MESIVFSPPPLPKSGVGTRREGRRWYQNWLGSRGGTSIRAGEHCFFIQEISSAGLREMSPALIPPPDPAYRKWAEVAAGVVVGQEEICVDG
jgi:hypothetical protein